MRVTLKDVARESGYSQSAVSLVLNGRQSRISEKGRRKIIETAQRLGYRASRAAQSLAFGRTGSIALIVPDIHNPFFSRLAKELGENAIRRRDSDLIIVNTAESLERDLQSLKRMDAQMADGIVYVPSEEAVISHPSALMAQIEAMTAPVVIVDRFIRGASCDQVGANDHQGAYLATRRLVKAGHSRIGCIAGPVHLDGNDRLLGYESALCESGVMPDQDLMICGPYSIQSGHDAVDVFLEKGVTAILCLSDMITAGVLQRLYELKIRVPDDISLISYDDTFVSFCACPGITCVSQSVECLATCALDMIFERMDGFAGPYRKVLIASTLSDRQSVQKR